MSKTLAEYVDCLPAAAGGKNCYALDVGTGTGIHAFVLNEKGFSVLAIDCNGLATASAYEHGVTAGVECRRVDDGKLPGSLASNETVRNSEVVFAAISLQELASQVGKGVKFSPIVFNPPGFFWVEDIDHSWPAATGVYAGPVSCGLDRRASLLYKFFERIVFPLLSSGGDVICTWPGLKRRVVELDPKATERGEVKHPADLLQSWFQGVTVRCADRRPDSFYRHIAVIDSDYGLGDSFWRNLEYGLRDPRCYSRLVTAADWRMGGRTTFRYGLLHLRRLDSGTNFETICEEGGNGE
jgi:hypothetical protein